VTVSSFIYGPHAATVSRTALGLTHVSNEVEPVFYLLRPPVFALIIAAITVKNRSR